MRLLQLLPVFVIALGASWLLQPFIRNLYARYRWLDRPNKRKVHSEPTPASGGVAIALAVAVTTWFAPSLQHWWIEHNALTISALTLLIIGALDDRFNLPARLRLGIQVLCAVAVVQQGILLSGLQGVLGITHLPVAMQYILSILILLLTTNAYNLIDGIDGLAGVMSLSGLAVMGFVAGLTGQYHWLGLIVALSGALLAFLKYNWRPARLFMGDSGATVFGFLLGVMAIDLVNHIGNMPQGPITRNVALALISGAIILPVSDTLRLFFYRIQSRRSPFSADKNHLHHWLLRHHIAHSGATLRLLGLKVMMLLITALAAFFISLTAVLLLQIGIVLGYTAFLKRIALFHNWYRQIRKMEQWGVL